MDIGEFSNETEPSNEDVIENFILMLKKASPNKPLTLYVQNEVSNKSFCKYNAKDVISNVTSTVKAIQNAANKIRTKKNIQNNLSKNKSSHFVPICSTNMECETLQQRPTIKFETQCFSNTQLINVIEEAEAVYKSHEGMTEEFDTSFETITQENNDIQTNSLEHCESNIDVDNIKGIDKVDGIKEEVDDIGIDIEEIDFDSDVELDNEVVSRSNSPILGTSTSFRSNNTPDSNPMSFDLNLFEQFEKIALPLMSSEYNHDKDVVKCLIKKQLDEKFFLNVRTKKTPANETYDLKDANDKVSCIVQNVHSNNSNTFDDVILFSSDEEEDYWQKSSRELPLSSALETSFTDDESDILENMSVCFKTASRKCTQNQTPAVTELIENLNDSLSYEECVHKVKEEEGIETQYLCDNSHLNNTSVPLNRDNENFSIFEANFVVHNASDKVSNATCEELCSVEDGKEIDTIQFVGNNKTSSNKTLAEAKNIFSDVYDNMETDTFNFKPKEELSNVDDFFKSEEVMNILEEPKGIKDFQDTFTKPAEEFKDQHVTNVGFTTASNKKIEISAKALAKSKTIFEDLDNIPIKLENNFGQHFKGFMTANNKEVNAPKNALIKSKSLFQDILQPSKEISPNMDVEPSSAIIMAAVNQSNKLINNTNIHKDLDIRKADDFHVKPSFTGFSTANNKKIQISEEALLNTKHLFVDLDKTNKTKDTNEETIGISKIKPRFTGFSTANNKEIQISKEALLKTKHLFDDLDKRKGTNEDKTENCEIKPSFFGFTTANNEKIEISEEALLKTRKLFNEFSIPAKIDNISPKFMEHINTKEDEIGCKRLHEHDNGEINEFEEKRSKNMDNNNYKVDNNYINTQIAINFEESLCTEDFNYEEKRSTSPILLSCPTKRKTFKTPFRTDPVKKNVDILMKSHEISNTAYKFDENYKKTKLLTLKDLGNECNEVHGIDPFLVQYDFDNLLDVVFEGKRNNLSENKFTIWELKNKFLTSVDRKIIPESWLENHLKLILWKLISYELKYPIKMNTICNAKEVIQQLKYRFDRELCKTERPALRKIYEKDESSARTLVLCVAKIYEDGVSVTSVASITSNIELELTDGWYCIRTVIDKFLSKVVYDGKIVVGTKMMTIGAELLNCDQGISPWEDTSNVRLQIHGNSTRRVRWHTRLGFHGNAAILTPLSTVKENGGRISKLRFYITRVYPMLYVEKFEDGSTVTRSERLEQLHEMKHESERQMQLEKIYEEIEREYDDGTDDSDDICLSGGKKRKAIDSGSQIAKLMKGCKDSEEFMSSLTSTQVNLILEYNNRKRERLLQDIQKRVELKLKNTYVHLQRNVVSVMKVRVADFTRKQNGVEICNALLSIRKPNENVLEMLTEGVWIEVFNVIPTAFRNNELLIAAGRQSIFNICKIKEDNELVPFTKSLNRICCLLKDLIQKPYVRSDFGEIDTVGLVFAIEPSTTDFQGQPENKQNFQNVYLTDENKNFVCVNFWRGLKKYGFENVLDTGQFVTCVNLQRRVGNTRKSIPQFRVTELSYFTKTPKNTQAKDCMRSLVEKFNEIDIKTFCLDCLNLKNQMLVKNNHFENVSPYRFKSGYNLSKHKTFIDTTLAQKTTSTDEFDLTGLDFESTFKQRETQEMSSPNILRKRLVNEKIAKLKMYGEPPPLSPIHIINKSMKASNSYRNPFLQKSDISNSVVGVKNYNISDNSLETNTGNKSPILNGTYVKRCFGNPVRLQFSNNIDKDDESPPLSLDYSL